MYIHIYMHIYMYVYIYMCIYIYTYIWPYIPSKGALKREPSAFLGAHRASAPPCASPVQRANHFPGSFHLGRKDCWCRVLYIETHIYIYIYICISIYIYTHTCIDTYAYKHVMSLDVIDILSIILHMNALLNIRVTLVPFMRPY